MHDLTARQLHVLFTVGSWQGSKNLFLKKPNPVGFFYLNVQC